MRGVFGDFVELAVPSDRLQPSERDAVYILVTGVFRIFAETALVTVPLTIWISQRLVRRAIRQKRQGS
jgi:hypothetical protein